MGWVYNASDAIAAQSRYPTIAAVCVVLSALSTFVVCTRIGMHWKAGHIAPDDYFAGISMVFGIIYSALCITQTRYGLGLPLKLRPKANLDTYTKVNFAGRPFYQLGILGFKIALCISYLRLLSGSHRKVYRYIIWAVMILVSAGHVAGCLVLIFNCKPVQRSWMPLIAGECLPFGPVNYGLAAITISSDVAVAFLPIPLLLGLNIRRSQKVALSGLFILGLFTTVCSIFRTLEIKTIAYGDGNSTMLIVWGVIELNVGNIVTSAPFLAPLIWRQFKQYRSKYSGGYGSADAYKYGSGGNSKNKYGSNKSSDASGNHDIQLAPAKGGIHHRARDFGADIDSKDGLQRTGSEDRILGDMRDTDIVKTVAYHVSVDAASERDVESSSGKSDQEKSHHSRVTPTRRSSGL